jgi:hypothetical protein
MLEPVVEAVTLLKYPQFFGHEKAYERWSLAITRRRMEFVFSWVYALSQF